MYEICSSTEEQTGWFALKVSSLHGHALRKHAHMIYSNFFQFKKSIIFRGKYFIFFLISAQNIDCGYTLEPPRGFRAKIRKMGIALHTPFLLYKSGV